MKEKSFIDFSIIFSLIDFLMWKCHSFQVIMKKVTIDRFAWIMVLDPLCFISMTLRLSDLGIVDQLTHASSIGGLCIG